MPLLDSEPALAEGERKVKRGLTGVVSAVPRIHLPTVRSRLLPRRPHLPPTAWAPRGTLNRPQNTSKTLQRPCWHLMPNACLVVAPLISRHLLGASTSSKRFRETLEQTLEIRGHRSRQKNERDEHQTHQIRNLCRECITAW